MNQEYKRILVTGCSGFLGRQLTQEFLSRGYFVRGTTRSTEELHTEIMNDFDNHPSLELRCLDLISDEGWGSAMQDIDAVIHTASPFSAYEPKDEQELIKPAREGTIRVLTHGYEAGIRKFVITSSTAAISGATPTSRNKTYSHKDWTNLDSKISAYTKSKTLAELAAWDFVESHPGIILTTINTGLASTSKAIRPTSTEKSITLSVVQAFFHLSFMFLKFILISYRSYTKC